jgi:hypothetical protein
LTGLRELLDAEPLGVPLRVRAPSADARAADVGPHRLNKAPQRLLGRNLKRTVRTLASSLLVFRRTWRRRFEPATGFCDRDPASARKQMSGSRQTRTFYRQLVLLSLQPMVSIDLSSLCQPLMLLRPR